MKADYVFVEDDEGNSGLCVLLKPENGNDQTEIVKFLTRVISGFPHDHVKTMQVLQEPK